MAVDQFESLPNCYQTLKISLALGRVFALRFAFMGAINYLEALKKRLNRKIGVFLGLITGVG